ncbi:MAG: hypothetical protein QM503_02090 [Bacteroidota bacterium]
MKKLTIILIALMGITVIASAQQRGVDFDGTDDYINTNYDPSLAIWSVECWVKGEAAPSTSDIERVVDGGSNFVINWGHSNPGYRGALEFYNNSTYYAASFGTLEAGVWYHLVGTYDGSNLKAYKNGVLITDNSSPTGDAESSTTMTIGASDGGSAPFAGIIDEVRIWSDVRTLVEISANMYSELSNPTLETNLVTYFKLNETSGTDASDASANSYTGTLNGNTFDVSSVGGAIPIYVDDDASGDGSSWANAYTSFQNALDIAVAGNEIWLATGTYEPSYDYGLNIASPNTERGYHFQMINGVEIYGGFAGTETSTSQRTDYGIGEANETILSGDVGTDSDSDNCYHVFYHPNGLTLSNTAILDGVTVSDGNADASSPHNGGGAMSNFSVSGGTTIAPTIKNCIFTNNQANYGNVLYIRYTSTIVKNCSFSNNNISTSTMSGGAIHAYKADNLSITNCLFDNNTGLYAGAVNIDNCTDVVITNCTFAYNTTTTGAGALRFKQNSVATLSNCIVWGNIGGNIVVEGGATITVLYSDIEGGYTGTDNINLNPLFANSAQNASHPYSLTGASPCADVGSDAANTETYDIRGSNFGRKLSKTDGSTGTIDMGAYEYKFETDPLGPIYYVNNSLSTGDNDGLSWVNAFNSSTTAFQDALDCGIWW